MDKNPRLGNMGIVIYLGSRTLLHKFGAKRIGNHTEERQIQLLVAKRKQIEMEIILKYNITSIE